MATAGAQIRLGAVRPDDAVAAFMQRKLLQPSFRWQEVWQAEHARAFAVAGVLRMDVLRAIREPLAQALAEGGNVADYVRTVKRQLLAKGFWGNVEITDPKTGEIRRTRFNDARLRLIFDVNMRQSYAAGTWNRAQRSRMPYLVYRTMRDEKVRASHRPWDNIVLPKDHPWWDTHYPPNGWRCRCMAFATDEKGLEQLRRNAPKEAPVKTEPPPTQWAEFVNRSSGQTERVPRGIDPGFAYNPGKVHVERGLEMLVRQLSAVRPSAPAANDALPLTRAVVARQRRERGFRQFLENPPKAGVNKVGLPVAVVPSTGGAPSVASVSAEALRRQQGSGIFPLPLPTTVAGWALAQAVIDQGQRLELDGGAVLYWWRRAVTSTSGGEPRVLVLELGRDALVWWVNKLQTLTVDEAVAAYPRLNGVV